MESCIVFTALHAVENHHIVLDSWHVCKVELSSTLQIVMVALNVLMLRDSVLRVIKSAAPVA